MSLGVSEEHEALHGAARRFLEARCPPSVPRALLDGPDQAVGLPPFWDELAGLGWLGLHLPEAVGGSGYGLAEVAVVLEELGRAVAPGPFLATVLASAAIWHGGTGGSNAGLLRDLADGSVVGTLVPPDLSDLHSEERADGSLKVWGTARPVLNGPEAAIMVAPAGGHWVILDASALAVEPLAGLDPTRRLGSVTVADALVPAERRLAGLDHELARDLMATLVAAECAGLASWCLATAAEYAKVREQFGRPIGQFQGVKHRCADMLISVEQARCAAWDAALALDTALGAAGNGEGTAADREQASLAASIAGALGPSAGLRCAKDCIQVLGGVGFTWEHDAHLYLKRATALHQLLDTSRWRARAATAALAGTRRHLRLELPEGAEALRDEVRAFAEAVAGLDRDERRRRLAESGYLVPHWPQPWGRSAGALEQLVIDQELDRARIRRPHLGVGAWAAPTIVAHGTVEQQERWVRPTLAGQLNWCQLFSEPGAGSDLASLTTKAVRVAGGWLLSGQKVWTTLAREADWGICLARTNPDVPKHLGITYFLVDMRSEGIDIRPLRELTGQAMFNEVFLTDVFVPDECVVGPVDGGWALARTTLANERVAMGSGSSFGGGLEAVLALISSRPELAHDPLVLDQTGALLADAQSVALLGLRTAARAVRGGQPGPESSVRKLLGVEHDQAVQEFGLALLGPEGATTEGPAAQWAYGFLANRCLTIAGGTSEIQRNVIAERLLGLPRDP
jgi:alkylation response protein AidB-like acyl-CoA dehydrogenase